MVLTEEDLFLGDVQFRLQGRFYPEFVDHPRNHRLPEDPPGLRVHLQARHKDAVQLAEGFLEKNDIIQVGALETSLVETEADSVRGETEVVLDPGKTFFFRGGYQHTIAQQDGGSVMVIARNSKDVHRSIASSPTHRYRLRRDGPATRS